MASLAENVAQAISDFDDIKDAIIEKGTSVPSGTHTSAYGDKIRNINTKPNPSSTTFFYRLFSNNSNLSDAQLTWFMNNIDTTGMKDYRYMLYACTNITTVQYFNTDSINGNGLASMFQYCYDLVNVPPIDTSRCTDITSMFASCKVLRTVQLSDTSNVKIFSRLFYQTPINNITLNINSAETVTDMFNSCTELTNLTFEGDFKPNGLKVPDCPLTITSLRSIITSLHNYSSGTVHSLTLGSTNIAKLDSTDLATITAKNWTYS